MFECVCVCWHVCVYLCYIVQCFILSFFQQDDEGNELKMFFSTDGEAIILREVFDEAVLKGFDDALVDYMKNGASLTSHQQPLDVSSVFKSVKTGVKKATQDQSVSPSVCLRQGMETVFRKLAAQFPSATMTSDRQLQLVEALEALTSVLQDKHLDSRKMQDGFVKCGHHVLDPERNGGCTVSLDTVLRSVSQFKDISEEDIALFLSKADLVCNEFLTKGRVSSAFLDEIGIPSDGDTIIRDEFVIWRDDAQLITHPHVVGRFRNYELWKCPQQSQELQMVKSMCDTVAQYNKRDAQRKAQQDKIAKKPTAAKQLSKEERDALAMERKAHKEERKRKQEEADLALDEEYRRVSAILGSEALDIIGNSGKSTKKTVKQVFNMMNLKEVPPFVANSHGQDDDVDSDSEEE